MTEKAIEKPWGIYFLNSSPYIGRVIRETTNGPIITDSEYASFEFLHCQRGLERFEKLDELILVYLSKYKRYSDFGVERFYNKSSLMQILSERFPRTIRQESHQRIHDILCSHGQRLIAEGIKRFPQNSSIDLGSKCPWADAHGRYQGQRDEGPFGPHPFKKDDGFIHPNKKY